MEIQPTLEQPFVKRISWGAVFAGLVVALAIQLLLTLLGVGIGASTIHPVSGDSATAAGLGIGSAVWFLITTLLALFAAGWVAGRLAGIPRVIDSGLHGILVWGLTALVTMYLLTTAIGTVLGGATSLFGSALGLAGAGVKAATPALGQAASSQLQKSGITVDTVTQRVQTMLKETGNAKLQPGALKSQAQHQANLAKNSGKSAALNPQATHQNINELVYRFLHDTGATSRAADRQALINVVASEQHISKFQAARTVDGWAQEARAAQGRLGAAANAAGQTARQAGENTASGLSKAGIVGFFLLLFGALAAAYGGYLSVPKELRLQQIASSRGRIAPSAR